MGEQHIQRAVMTPGLYGPGYGWGPSYYGRRNVTAYEYHDGEWEHVKRSGVTTHEDHEGTLIVDLAESSKKELVWRTTIRAVSGDNLEANFKMANKGVAKAFKDYPPAK